MRMRGRESAEEVEDEKEEKRIRYRVDADISSLVGGFFRESKRTTSVVVYCVPRCVIAYLLPVSLLIPFPFYLFSKTSFPSPHRLAFSFIDHLQTLLRREELVSIPPPLVSPTTPSSRFHLGL
jgi:hypothetical protein